MCDELPPEHLDSESSGAGDSGADGWSRRRLLQSGLVLGAFAAAPPITVKPFLPDPGRETPGAEPPGARMGRSVPRPNWPVPPIVTRAEWGADESLRAPDADYDFDSVVTKLVVHHTVTPNTATNDASVVRGVYNYHTSVGYNDIAYNFLIGRDGRLYEGRWAQYYANGALHTGENATGKNVRAAHSTATNTQTIGVALLGDYRTVRPTDAQLDMLTTFLAWKVARWGLEVYSAVPYLDGRVFPTIVGHRDVTQTGCPGDVAYDLLEFIRAETTLKSRPGTHGYWTLGRQGRIQAMGDLPDLGDPRRNNAASPMAGIAAHPANLGYWCVGTDGGIFTYGYVRYFGSMGGQPLNRPIVGMAPTPSGNGYWMVASDGGIFTFGDARFFGSTGSMKLNQPVVGMAPTKTGNGYWLVASDGGIFTFGDAEFFGSTGSMKLNQPVVGMAPTKTGNGYWLVASDGGIFTFGDAQFFGSTGSIKLNRPIVGMAPTKTGNGYYLVAADGGIFTFGDARFDGAYPDNTLDCVGMALRA